MDLFFQLVLCRPDKLVAAMTPKDYIEALMRAGIPENLPVGELDRRAAALLKVSASTSRHYRNGDAAIPGPVQVALKLLAREK